MTFMHLVFAALDSSAPSVYLIFGLILLFGATVARRLTGVPKVALQPSRNVVVPIDQRSHAAQTIEVSERLARAAKIG